MPRKRILTKEEVLDTALKITEEKGVEALSSRSLAMALHTSTQPLFTLFHGMEEILSGVKEKAYAVYDGLLLEALQKKTKPFKAVGIAYICFASEKRNLFRLIFMSENDQTYNHFTIDHNASSIRKSIKEEYHISEEETDRLYFESWIFTHGLAVAIVTGTASFPPESISGMLTDVVQGILLKFAEERKGPGNGKQH
ncbi:MAG: hypothetical protein WCR16_02710 [Bacilli bacterium]|jgi:AcrR family transcriptional regulator